MRVGLFIPCYIDQFYPQVGMATVDVLERYGVAGRISRGADLLRPADGERGLARRRPAAGGAVSAHLCRVRLRRVALGKLRGDGAASLRAGARPFGAVARQWRTRRSSCASFSPTC